METRGPSQDIELEMTYFQETPAQVSDDDDLPVFKINARNITSKNLVVALCPSEKTMPDTANKSLLLNLESLITAAATELGLPLRRNWRIQYDKKSTITLQDSTTKISFTGPRGCGGFCIASMHYLQCKGSPNLCQKIGSDAQKKNDKSTMVKRPGTAVTIKEPTLIQIEAYYNRVDEGGKPLTTEYTPNPSRHRSRGTDNKGCSEARMLEARGNSVPFTGPKGKYTADFAKNRIMGEHDLPLPPPIKVAVDAKKPSSEADIAAVERLLTAGAEALGLSGQDYLDGVVYFYGSAKMCGTGTR
ncbi:hypothetical protein BT96DRAFT_991792 [Gymnopus androsaceus JB14]|uniref:Uncharacterized protein n=1 Tax=Gymnopus androsaceus JB14 TaxID=1447944 RepID=A0A6A4HTN5_9AGAR|nr:hypothetical protein BT96DRAFT_991792 [Gymnopus androsaceus JB14]